MRGSDGVKVRGAQAAALTSMLLIAQQVAGKAARDALFLSEFHTSSLPLAMALGAILSLASIAWLSRLVVKYTPAAVMPVLFGVSACGYAGEWAMAGHASRGAVLLVYFQTAVLGPVLISTFWSLINERFDPHTAKRAVSLIATGGTLGGVLGGLGAWRASAHIEPITVLLVLALVNGLAVVGTLVTRARRQAAPAEVAAVEEGATEAGIMLPVRTLRTEPFLRNLALLVGLGAAISAILDYLFGIHAAAAFAEGQPLLSFFALFWLGVSVLSFVLQLALGKVALEKLGLAVNIAILPGIIVLGGSLGLAVPGLASTSLLRGAEAVQRNTLFRSAYELLYTPVPAASKRATKALIDVGCDRAGTVLGSGLALLVLHGLADGQGQVLLCAVIVLAVATLPLTRQLHVGYVQALQQGLREQAARLEQVADPDQPPVSIGRLTRPTTELKREQLIDHVERLQPGGLTALVEANGAERAEPQTGPAADWLSHREAALAATRALSSGQPAVVRGALRSLAPHRPAVACAILLLADRQYHEDAVQGLRAIAPQITGQLLDALLDPDMDFVVRRRIPRTLRDCPTQRAADGLLLGIADQRFEVRYECGRALVRVTDANPALVVSREKVLEAIIRQAESTELLAERSSSQFDEPERDEPSDVFDELLRDRANRSLEHMFSILSLVLERQPLRMAFKALHHDDETYRGTALEYLDTVLPGEVRDVVWPFLGETAPLSRGRSPAELLADLVSAAEARAPAS